MSLCVLFFLASQGGNFQNVTEFEEFKYGSQSPVGKVGNPFMCNYLPRSLITKGTAGSHAATATAFCVPSASCIFACSDTGKTLCSVLRVGSHKPGMTSAERGLPIGTLATSSHDQSAWLPSSFRTTASAKRAEGNSLISTQTENTAASAP